MDDVCWRIGTLTEANMVLDGNHYLGPVKSGGARLVVVGETGGALVAAQVWRGPTSRSLPKDGSWLELSRWCLTPAAGECAGSRCHASAARIIRASRPEVTTLVSYSDPGHGHTGALYRACNWLWAPTWLRLRPPPTANGNWGGKATQHVKDRWVFPVRKDRDRADVLTVNDPGAIRHWLKLATDAERKWAATTLSPDLSRSVQQ